jgi:hypothetical protein
MINYDVILVSSSFFFKIEFIVKNKVNKLKLYYFFLYYIHMTIMRRKNLNEESFFFLYIFYFVRSSQYKTTFVFKCRSKNFSLILNLILFDLIKNITRLYH